MRTTAATPRTNSNGVIVSIPPDYRDALGIPDEGARVAILPREEGPGVVIVPVSELSIGRD